MAADLPPPPRRDVPPRRDIQPPAEPSTRPPTPIWKKGWVWVTVIVAVVVIVSTVDQIETDGGTEGEEATSDCLQPSDAWLDTLASGFRPRHRAAEITSSAYVQTETSEGTAYYVAVTVEGVPGVAVFGTNEAPLQADPGLVAGANSTARELSISGTRVSEDSPAGIQLLDDDGTLAAEGCL